MNTMQACYTEVLSSKLQLAACSLCSPVYITAGLPSVEWKNSCIHQLAWMQVIGRTPSEA